MSVQEWEEVIDTNPASSQKTELIIRLKKRAFVHPKESSFMKIIRLLAFTFLILIGTAGSIRAQEDDYSFFEVRKQLKALDGKLKPIKEIPASIQASAYGPGDYEREIEVGGRVRRYEMHIPSGYTKERSWPVVINYHGGGGRGASTRLESGLDSKADRAGFIAVYPDGTGLLRSKFLTWNAGGCCGYAMENNVDDVGFTRALLDDLGKLFHLDSGRVYATGLSNGAFMTYRLACELSDRIAAIAPVAGAMVLNTCRPSRPASVIHFHGTADPCVPYKGGIGDQSVSKTDFPSVSETIQGWLQRLGIPPEPLKKEKRGNVEIATYGAEDGTEIILVTIAGGGHTWPGGKRMLSAKRVGSLDDSVSANDMMWDFFQRHPLKPDRKDPGGKKTH